MSVTNGPRGTADARTLGRSLPPPPRLLDEQEAAEYLRTTKRWVRMAWAARELPAVKIGRSVRFRIEDLDRYIDEHLVDARQPARPQRRRAAAS